MKQAQKGFTLIEAMVVMAITGIGVALAAPTISDLSRRHQENEATILVEGVLRDARNLARASRRCVQVTVLANEIKSAKRNCTGFERHGASSPVLAAIERTSILKVGSKIKVSAPSAPLLFHPYGGTTNIDEITIEIRSLTTGNEISELTVFPGIGTIRKKFK